MRGLVGVDAGVLDEAEAGAADVGVLVGGDVTDDGGAVEADVEVAGASDFYAGDAFGERRRRARLRVRLRWRGGPCGGAWPVQRPRAERVRRERCWAAARRRGS